ncbi:MAG: hypothetical protein ABEJ58_04395 [Halodesulfurarchaeum sp.]
MRAYRFVEFLGSEFERAGRSVAESALVEFDHRGGLSSAGTDGTNHRVGFELIRRIARRLDGTERPRIHIDAHTWAPIGNGDGGSTNRRAIGMLYVVSLPGFEHLSAVLGETYYEPHFTRLEHSSPETVLARVRNRIETTPAVFLFVVGESGVRVVPGHAASSLRTPTDGETIAESLYSKSLKRFTEGFAEGFFGDPSISASVSPDAGPTRVEEACRSWAREYDLGGVLFFRISPAPTEEASSLQDFV